MSNTPHTLAEEFPRETARISALKAQDAHFARLLDEYDTVNDAVHRAETRIEPMSDEAETALRQRRSRLKDEISRALTAA